MADAEVFVVALDDSNANFLIAAIWYDEAGGEWVEHREGCDGIPTVDAIAEIRKNYSGPIDFYQVNHGVHTTQKQTIPAGEFVVPRVQV